MSNLIWTVAVILFIFWVLGFSINIGGSLIHILLVLALIAIVYNLMTGRRIG
ncbi:lmo0937 family membrane protein [Crocosphaera sp. XPORK-15E]|uniref:lmo0937 family membrane protein n=1 Tax=Crocosphaera sp. XPORK-15E TaxID=3110247 RepID=UPI002B20C0C8|nr:lmo0937 family membrane protein [Crocosphaera sp. XPORK-15E]MEA5534657.1 lmo0937 family membrane protein [Crocosphaera sp. XPORK-15E]